MVVGSGQAACRATEAAWDTDVTELLTLLAVAPDRSGAHVVQTNYQVAIFGGQLLGQALSAVSRMPHCDPVPDLDMKFASIDHCMWFHRPARVGDWMLYDTESPSASDGTGFARGTICDRAGRVIASTAQEVLQVPRRKKI